MAWRQPQEGRTGNQPHSSLAKVGEGESQTQRVQRLAVVLTRDDPEKGQSVKDYQEMALRRDRLERNGLTRNDKE